MHWQTPSHCHSWWINTGMFLHNVWILRSLTRRLPDTCSWILTVFFYHRFFWGRVQQCFWSSGTFWTVPSASNFMAALAFVDFFRSALGLSRETLQGIPLYTVCVKGNAFILWPGQSLSTTPAKVQLTANQLHLRCTREFGRVGEWGL